MFRPTFEGFGHGAVDKSHHPGVPFGAISVTYHKTSFKEHSLVIVEQVELQAIGAGAPDRDVAEHEEAAICRAWLVCSTQDRVLILCKYCESNAYLSCRCP